MSIRSSLPRLWLGIAVLLQLQPSVSVAEGQQVLSRTTTESPSGLLEIREQLQLALKTALPVNAALSSAKLEGEIVGANETFSLVLDGRRYRLEVTEGESRYLRIGDGAIEYRVNHDSVGIVNANTAKGAYEDAECALPGDAGRYLSPLFVTINSQQLTVPDTISFILSQLDSGGVYGTHQRMLTVTRANDQLVLEDGGDETGGGKGRTAFRIVLDSSHKYRLVEFGLDMWTNEGRHIWQTQESSSIEYDANVGGELIPIVGKMKMSESGERAKDRGGPFQETYIVRILSCDIGPDISRGLFDLSTCGVEIGTVIQDARFQPTRYYRYAGKPVNDVDPSLMQTVVPGIHIERELAPLDLAAAEKRPAFGSRKFWLTVNVLLIVIVVMFFVVRKR